MFKSYKLNLNTIPLASGGYRNLLTSNDHSSYNDLVQKGSVVESNHPKFSLADLKACIIGGHVDVEKLKEKLFPTNKKYHVFLSHSSIDITYINKLVGLLSSKGLSVFVDSYYWGNVYEVLREYDNVYSLGDEPHLYEYNKVKYSTRSLYTILTTCLNCVIDQSDCFIFVQSDNSLFKIDEHSYTESSWIYEELHFASLVRRRTSLDLSKLKPINESLTRAFSKASFAFSIDYFTNKMETLTFSALSNIIASGDEYLIKLFNSKT